MRRQWMIFLLAGLLALATLVSLCLGRYPVGAVDLARFAGFSLLDRPGYDPVQARIVKTLLVDIRLPRVAAAILIGAALSVSGAVFQSMFINPLVSPGLLGVLAGAAFGAAVGMILGKSWFVVQISAFGFGIAAVFTALALSSLKRGDRILMLVLGGIISGALFTSLLSVIKYLADPYDTLPAIVYWLMGGLGIMEKRTVLAVCGPILFGIGAILSLSNHLNALSMGDEEARSLGLHVGRLRLAFILLATVISALTVVMGGIIGWVGLLVPHMARMMVGPDNRVLLPACALAGGFYLLAADNFARLLFSVEIPIGILTSLVGIPAFAFVLKSSKKGWQ